MPPDIRGEADSSSPLAERAVRTLKERGACSNAELAQAVFGPPAAMPIERWLPLLDALLAGDPRAEHTEVGWSLVAADLGRTNEELDDAGVLGLALSATGADPRRHRIVRIAAVRRDPGGIVARFDAVVNASRRLPRYLEGAARVGQDDADGAPTFREIWTDLRSVIGHGPVHAFGAGWVRAFLEAELTRAELPALDAEFVELGDQCPAATGKPTLPAMAKSLGINHPRPGFAPADADVAARVALAARQRASGLVAERSADPAHLVSGGTATAPAAPHRPALLDRRWLIDVPRGPGVYLIEDVAGAILYVGKAVNLYRRLTAYLGRAFGLHRQLDGLAARAANVRVEPTPTDVEARLLEARLLRRHAPPFNVQRRVRRSATVIRVSPNDPKPSARTVSEPAADGATYFGPFRSATVARAHLDLAREVYPAAVGRGVGTLAERREAAHGIMRLLSGQREPSLTVLRARLRGMAASGNHLALERTRRLVREIIAFEPCPSPLLGTSLDEPLLVLDPLPSAASIAGTYGTVMGDGVRVHLVREGRIVASVTVDGQPAPHELCAIAEQLADNAAWAHRDPRIDDADDLHDANGAEPAAVDDDHAHIVMRWLLEHAPRRTIVPLRSL